MPEYTYNQKAILGPENYDKYRELLDKGFYPQTMRNMLHLNQGNGYFSEIGQYAGISQTDWSWAVLAADFDNDGWKDLFVANGYARNYLDMDFLNYMVSERIRSTQGGAGKEDALIELIEKMPPIYVENYLYHNNGDLTFTNRASEWGITGMTVSNAAAYADLDGDGDLDLVVCHTNAPVSIYRNNSETLFNRHHLKIRLRGEGMNTKGIGAKVQIYAGDRLFHQELMPVRGYQSAVSHELVIGLGEVMALDSLDVWWPDGRFQRVMNPPMDTLLVLDQRYAWEYTINEESTNTLFSAVPDALGLTFVHQESPFLDFIQDRLMPNTMSGLGPKLAVGDIDQDGLDDIFVCGGLDQAGIFYKQLPNGSFSPIAQPTFEADRAMVDTDAVLVDVNGNGHMDLYVVSGGGDYPSGHEAYQDRLYINGGKGNFERSLNSLPDMAFSGSTVQAADVDNDGFPDLFVGGRYIPGSFPIAPRSYLLKNRGDGTFVDVTERFCPELLYPGLVSGAKMIDLDGDAWVDLVITGEWMAPQVFINQEGKSFVRKPDAMPQETSGWWKYLEAVDLDGDGDMDLLMGNQGENNSFKPDEHRSMRLVFKDFDGNGSVDPLFTYYMADTNAFAFSRDEFVGQLPSFKGKFSDYRSFATTPIARFLTTEQLAGADTLLATTLQSGYFRNDGKGKFDFMPFPPEAQFSPLFATATLDINGDGHLDLLTGGNETKSRVSFGQQDANSGFILVGDGMGNFKTQGPASTGINLRGDVRDIELLTVGAKTYACYVFNNGQLRVFALNP